LTTYYMVHDEKLVRTTTPPAGLRRWQTANAQLHPPLVTALHRSLQAWGDVGYSPGPIAAANIWFSEDGALAIAKETPPKPLMQIGLAPDLAAWLVLLDQSMATFVVVARARALWSVEELAAALTFLTPAFLPRELVEQAPNNCERVAQAVAAAVADGPMATVQK
jgi:hypothetical protein